MVNMVEHIKGQIKQVVDRALIKASESREIAYAYDGELLIEKPREKSHGDYACNIAMQLSKSAKVAPRIIAEELLSLFDFEGTYIKSADVAGPGFINFFLKEDWLYDTLCQIEEKGNNYGKQTFGDGKKVMVEFVSANPTGPMHMGNARGGSLGDSLAEVLTWVGYEVTREFYLNDAGAQIEKLSKSLDARFIQIIKGDDAIEFPEDGYQGSDIRENMQEFIAEFGTDFINMEVEKRKEIFTYYVLQKNLTKLEDDLRNFGINYDVWFRETSLYKSGEVEETLEILQKSGYTYEAEDALWFKSSAFGCEKDDVLIRNNGIPTYFAVDIAYHRNKFITRGFDKVINIWGADHHGHIARMKGAMVAIGVDPERLHVITMQLVRLIQEGKPVRMSKRTGQMITFCDLVEDIGVDAARFFFNLRQADSHFDFDLDLATSSTNDNPVFYVQYAHARICSMLSLLAGEGIIPKKCSDLNMDMLLSDEEKSLIIKLADFPEEIRLAAITYDPSRLTRYSVDVASLFHSFYNACRVRGEEDEVLYSRLKLVELTRQVIKLSLSILGVTTPEKM